MPAAQTTAAKASVKPEGKTERKSEKKVESVKEEKAPKETMVDMSSVGMGGVLDDVSWFEQMADLTGGEKRSPTSTKEKNAPKKK
ncbi:hypothetical protein AN958_11491 [Leucoagaricus sp. SymC.cos]|nr:hypothetical protein AN958_11491 [Leucoagaricus sp. SymC.cos]